MMNENLEALIMDQALGELSPGASWLLDQYMAEHPECQSDAASIRHTIGLTQDMHRGSTPSEPALPPTPSLGSARRGLRYRLLLWPAACAACLLLGWFVRTAIPPAVPGQSTNVMVADQATSHPKLNKKPLVALTAADVGSFWSVRSWAEQAARPVSGEATPTGIQWKGPFEPKLN